MKTNIITNNTNMKQYMKYLCAVLLLIGTSASAWGTTCTLYGGLGGNTAITTITNGSTIPVCSTNGATWDIAYSAGKTIWTTSKYSSSNPTTTFPTGTYVYYSGSTLPDGITALYAVYVLYGESTYYSGAPGYQLSLSPVTGSSYADANKYIAIQPGTSITITAHPEVGTSVTEWIVLDSNKDPITPTSTTATTFVFNMPSGDVEAEVRFYCPDISGESLTITPSFVYNNSTSKIDATISWSEVEGATSYDLLILNPDASTLVDESGILGTSYDVTNITNNMSSDDFTISVTARNACSNVEEVIDYDFYCKQPNSSTVTASSITTTGARISWDAVEGISEYRMIILNSGKDARIGDVHTTSNTYFDVSDLSAGTTYYARMTVTNDCGRMRHYTSEAFHTQYLVTYDANGGENAPAAVAIASGTTNLPTVGSMSRTGYTFGGWLEGSPSGTLRDVGYTHTVTENITFYAKWTPKTTTIKLHDNNGDANSGTASVDYDATTLTSISHASKAGNTLLGYYDADSDGNIVLTNTGTFVNATGYVVGGKWANESADVTLYAYWSTNSHSVTFDMQGLGSSVASQNKELNQYVDEPSPAPTDPDYNFGGWYKEAGCENTWVFSSDKMPDDDLTLYAKWTPKRYQKRIFACVDISVDLETVDEAKQKVLITSRNGVNIMGVRKLLVTVDGALSGHTVSITSDDGLKFYKLDGGKYVELTGAANVLRAPLDDAEVYVSYNPTSAGDGSITTPHFTIACDGESQEFNTSGEYVKVRNLPDAVAIVANVGGSWHGLSANITSSSTPKDQMVAVATDGGLLKAYAPTAGFGYTLWQVRTVNSTADRWGDASSYAPAHLFGDRLRFAGNSSKGLLANNNSSSNQYNINNTGTINSKDAHFTNDENYEWKVTTREVDGQFVYTLQTDQTNNNRYLRLWNGRWGTYQDGKGTEDLYLLPIVETALVDMKPYEWGTDQVVVCYTPSATPVALTGVNMGSDAAASPTFTQLGSSDLWRVSGLSGITGKPAQQLQVMITENGAAKQGLLQIPLIVSGNSTEAELRSSLTGANMTEKNKVAKNTDVVILSTGKLTTETASGNFKDLYIYAGGKAIVSNAMSFGDMYMRGGFGYIGAETWDVPRAKIDAAVSLTGKMYYDLTMDATKYYDLAVPYEVDLNEATDDKGDGDFNVWLKIYDGAKRASDLKKGWDWYNWEGDLKLHPGTGYLIEATPRYNRSYCTVRFPMNPDLSSGETAKDVIAVTAHGMNNDGTIQTGKTANNVGWNFIANPYMCNFGTTNISESTDGVLKLGQLVENGEHKYEWDTEGAKNIRYVTTFNYNSQEYAQHPLSTEVLAPFTGFFVQIGKSGSVNFTTAGRQLLAPAYLLVSDLPSDMEITLIASGNGQNDEARLHINNELTRNDALEFPDEMTKQINAGKLNFYTISDNTNMYANGMSYEDAQDWIPAGVMVPSEGTYTFSVGEVIETYIKGVLLKDMYSGYEYDLLKSSPQFVLDAGTNDERFAVKIVLVEDNGILTGVDELETDGERPMKFIYDDKIFILNNKVIYDATGKKVREINK